MVVQVHCIVIDRLSIKILLNFVFNKNENSSPSASKNLLQQKIKKVRPICDRQTVTDLDFC